jgi:nucleotide-binding universal stress UspA family protein
MNNPPILVAVDDTEISRNAVREAVVFARRLEAPLIFLHVVDIRLAGGSLLENPALQEDVLRKNAQELLNRVLDGIDLAGTEGERLVRIGIPVDEIVATARDRGAQPIVMGTHGRLGLSRAILGSVAEGVVRHAAVPVLVIPAV